MSGAVRSVPVQPASSNGTRDDTPSGGSDDHGSSPLTYELAQAALARSNEDVTRYATIGQLLERLESKVDETLKDVRGLGLVSRTTADGVSELRVTMTRQELRLASVERATRDADERHGKVMAALARIEGRSSQHDTTDLEMARELAEARAETEAARILAAAAEKRARTAHRASAIRIGTIVTAVVLTVVTLAALGPERVIPLLDALRRVLPH